MPTKLTGGKRRMAARGTARRRCCARAMRAALDVRNPRATISFLFATVSMGLCSAAGDHVKTF
jgi:hypothetical protein